MKWLFVLAVLLNIAFFSYNNFYGQKEIIKTIEPVNSGENQIVLLNELDSEELKKLQEKVFPSKQIPQYIPQETAVSDSDVDSETGSPETAIEAEVPKTICYLIGPFTKQGINQIRFVLEKDFQNNLSFEIETTSAATYYRIYIPPLKDKVKIKEVLAKLNNVGLTDHYVMSIDGRKNAIALGVFRNRNAAENIALTANKAGFATTIEAISDDKNSQYKLRLLFDLGLDMSKFQELISSKNIELTECKNKG